MEVAGAVADLIDIQGSSVLVCLENGWDATAQVRGQGRGRSLFCRPRLGGGGGGACSAGPGVRLGGEEPVLQAPGQGRGGACSAGPGQGRGRSLFRRPRSEVRGGEEPVLQAPGQGRGRSLFRRPGSGEGEEPVLQACTCTCICMHTCIYMYVQYVHVQYMYMMKRLKNIFREL